MLKNKNKMMPKGMRDFNDLQLATSQYGVEFSTPQPRILIAEKKTEKEMFERKTKTNHDRRDWIR